MRTLFALLASAALAAAALLASGLPVAAASPAVVVGYTDTLFSFSGSSPRTVTGPSLAAGTWWVTATAELDASSSSGSLAESLCQLIDDSNNAVIDRTPRFLDNGHATGRAVLDLMLTGVERATIAWHPQLQCSGKSTASVTLTNIRFDAVSGSLTSGGGPRFRVASAGPQAFPGDSNFHTVAAVSLPAGHWALFAKTNVSNPSFSVPVGVTCRLSPSSADTDRTAQTLAKQATGDVGIDGEVATNVAHNFSQTTVLKYSCRGDSAGGFTVDQVRIVAVQAGKLTRVVLGGGSSSSGSGTPAVITGSKAMSTAIPMSGTLSQLASLPLPAGKWYVFAKAWLHGADMLVECHLETAEGGGHIQDMFVRGDTGGSTGVYLQNGMDISSPAHAALSCRSDTPGASFTFIRITAVKASSVSFVFLG